MLTPGKTTVDIRKVLAQIAMDPRKAEQFLGTFMQNTADHRHVTPSTAYDARSTLGA